VLSDTPVAIFQYAASWPAKKLANSRGQGTKIRDTMEAQEDMEFEEAETWASGIEAMLARMADRFL
jgi:hypothetical protein